jgi:p24 family protein beta-1
MHILFLIALGIHVNAKNRIYNTKSSGTKDYKNKKFDLPDNDEASQLIREWDDKMQGFVPEDMITFQIPARSEEEFYEEIYLTPTILRGAWFLASSNDKDIDFSIYDPLKSLIFERNAEKEGIFYFEVARQGTYVFKFKNNKVLKSHLITFAFNSGNFTDKIQTSDLINPVEEKLLSAEKGIKDFQADNQFAQIRQETHFITVASANSNVFWFSLLESIGVIAATALQIYYVKKLLDNRRLV